MIRNGYEGDVRKCRVRVLMQVCLFLETGGGRVQVLARVCWWLVAGGWWPGREIRVRDM